MRCEACGVYFAKLQQQAALREAAVRRSAAPGPADAASRSMRGVGLGGLAVAMVLTGAAVYWYMRLHMPPGADSDIAAVQAARRATVFIKTGWGAGSGFIVDEQCHVITNRHVVETDTRKVELKVQRDLRPDIAQARARLQAQLLGRQQELEQLRGQPGTEARQAQLEDLIERIQMTISTQSEHIQDSIADEVDDTRRLGFIVSLPDGTTYPGIHAQLSADSDLALFQLPAVSCPFIPIGRARALAVGQRVYTVGNPGGPDHTILKFTVTSGVFSGMSRINGTTYVQSDAPINPGNSGGPLITAQGQVVGINTLIVSGKPGLGFAIPIEAVFDAFPQIGFLAN